MRTIDFVVRDSAGRVVRGIVEPDAGTQVIDASANSQVSLNILQQEIVDYGRIGNNLQITLADGRKIMIEDFFIEGQVTGSRLYVSSGGEITEISFSESWGRTNYAHMNSAQPADGSLIFDGNSNGIVTRQVDSFASQNGLTPADSAMGGKYSGGYIGADTYVSSQPYGAASTYTGADVSMAAAPLFGAAFGPGAVAAVGAGLLGVGAVVAAGGDEDTTGPEVALTSDLEGTYNAEDLEDGLTLEGTGEPGATITVEVGGTTETVTIPESGEWSVDFDSSDFESGEYDAEIVITGTDEAGNTTVLTETITIDTIAPSSEHDAPIEGDDVINIVEASDGFAVTGQTEPGSTVTVTVGTATVTVVADADGNWTSTFAASDLPEGEYTVDMVVSVVDVAGNASSSTSVLTIDTIIGATFSAASVEDNGLINIQAASDGVSMAGSADAGSTVAVTVLGVTQTVTAGADGSWTVTFPSSTFPAMEGTEDVTVAVTDVAGNVTTIGGTVTIDTMSAVTLNSPTAGDGVVNLAELEAGFPISGTADAGSSVLVTLGGFSQTVTAGSDGSWSLMVPGNGIASGTYGGTITAVSTDPSGNMVDVSQSIQIDSEVENLAVTGLPVTVTSVLNAVMSMSGVTISGTVEPGATVNVTFEGTTRAATVNSDGTWSVDFANTEIPVGEYAADISVAAVDANGNTATTTATFDVDTLVPESMTVVGTTVLEISGNEFVSDLFTLISDAESYEITALLADGSQSDIPFTVNDDPGFGTTEFQLGAPVSIGSSLVVTAIDDNDNQTSTLVVTSEPGSPAVVDLSDPMYQGFEIDSIDLARNAENAEVTTLTEADIAALSQTSDSLTIYGGSDDSVTLEGATATSATQTINAETFDVYTLGTDGVSVVINSEVDVTII